MLNFKTKYKAGDIWHRSFDDEAWDGQHGKMVRVYFDKTYYYYDVDIAGEVPTDEEQANIIDKVDTMFYDHLHLCDNNHELECPFKFDNDNVYCFNIS